MSQEYTRRISTLGNVPSHGPFIFFDDFESTLKWSKYEGEGDSIFELDPTISYSKNQSLHLKTRTENAAESDIIGAKILLYMSPSKKLNQAIHFKSPDFTKLSHLQFWFTLFDGSHQHYATLQLRPADPKWQYRTDEVFMEDIPDSAFLPLDDAWHRLQLQADLNTNKYISMIFDNHLFDLSGLSYYHTTSDILTHFDITIEIHTAGASPCELHIDDFLLHEL